MAIRKLPSTGDVPRSTGVPESLVPGGAADSAGFPWAGRTFEHHDTAFDDDDGTTPEGLRAAVLGVREAAARFAAAGFGEQASALGELAEAHTALLVALATSRLLMPLTTEAGDIGVTPEGKTVEKTQELAVAQISSPDGRRVIPAFTSTAAMRRWRDDARPIPIPVPQLALAAAGEGADLVIIDPGSPESECGIRRPGLRALAMNQRVLPSWADAEVRAACVAALAGEDRIAALALLPGDPEGRLLTPELEVHVQCAPGVGRDELDSVLGVLQTRFAENAVIADRVDSMRVVPRLAP